MRQKPNLAQNLLFLYLCRSFRSFTFISISNWSYMCSISEVICLSVTPSTIHTKHCTIFTSSSLEAFFSCMDMPSKMLLRLRRTLGGRWDSGMAVPGFSGSIVAYMRSPARTEPMHLTWITPITQTTSVSSKRKRGTPNYTEIGDLLCRCYDTEKCMYVKFTWITLFTNPVFLYCCCLCLRGCLYMTPGRLSRPNEFTTALSHGSTFVYMIPPQSVMPARVTPAWVHPDCCTEARISLRCEISQQYHVTTTRFGVKSVCR